MTEALASAWADVRAAHPDVPEAVIGLAPGPAGSACSSVTWDDPVLLAAIPEGAQARDVLTWLLHQAAHGLAAHAGPAPLPATLPAEMSIPDAAQLLGVSHATAYRLFKAQNAERGRTVTRRELTEAAQHRQRPGATAATEGRYHSTTYRAAAERLGLNVTKDANPVFGWNHTTMPEALTAAYAATISNLATALRNWEPPVPPARAARASSRNGVTAHCQCSPPRRIRVTESVLDLGTIRCDICGQPFLPAAPRRRSPDL